MRNVRLQIEYDGTDFQGWQRQLDRPTIQAFIEDNLAEVLGRRTVIYGASRTDSGVHARGQVANFYTDGKITPAQWRSVLNFRLPKTIRILESSEMPLAFHAQRDALDKVYEYRILNRPVSSALDRRVLFYPKPLDWAAMRATLPHFVGTKDFRSFQGAKAERKTTVRTIHSFDLFEDAPGLYRFRICGSGFLKQMVRTIVGTLLEVGEGKRTIDSIPAVIASGQRQKAGRTISAYGLCLVEIRYPEFSWWRPA